MSCWSQGRSLSKRPRQLRRQFDVARDIARASSGRLDRLSLRSRRKRPAQSVCPGKRPHSASRGSPWRPQSKSTIMHSRKAPADYRIQKMRAAQESARQMNDYVKVRGVASRSAIGASLLDVLDAPCLTHPTLTFRSLSCRPRRRRVPCATSTRNGRTTLTR